MEKKELKEEIKKVLEGKSIYEMSPISGLNPMTKEEIIYWIVETYIDQELDKAREEGRREQAELDRTLYGVSFEHIKNADFEKILLESVDKAKENIIKDLIKKIEEAHCDSISLELLKQIDLSKLKQ